MTYDVLGRGPLDYFPCRYAGSKLMFRGPKRDLTGSYLAFVGTTETYGKFIEAPFPALIEEGAKIVCANLGQITAGIDAFATDPFVMETTSNAEITVIQIMGAQNMTNRFYSVHPRRNDRFLSAATILRTIYREVDFSDFNFNRHMLSHLLALSPDRFEAVQQELQEAWMARMRFILGQIKGKTILLWMAGHAPNSADHPCPDNLGPEPLFVTREMIDGIREHATAYVESVASAEALDEGVSGMIFSELDAPAAAEMLGPMAHRETASALAKVIAEIY